jgi:lipopolysaccharide transport system permease protein
MGQSPNRIIIEPSRRHSNYWKDVWKFRELFYFLAWRDILVRYKQTVIGIAWSILRPLLTILIFTFFYTLLGKSPDTGTPVIILICAGMLPWQYFASVFTEASNSLIANSGMITKIYFPRIIVPVSTVIACLLDLLISFAIIIGFMLYYQYLPTYKIIYLPVLILLATLTAMGSGLLIAALNVKYRDFRYIIPFVVQIGLYVSPVVYSSGLIYSSQIPSWAKLAYSLNPMVSVIDGFRWSMLKEETILYWPGLLLSFGISILLLIAGIRYFRRTERNFADLI